MYYAFNAFTGRLISTSHARAFVPQGLHMLAISKVVAKTTAKTAVAASAANISSSSPLVKSAVSEHGEKLPPASERIKRLQEFFQRDLEVPVYLSGGPMDKYLYYSVVGLCTGGFGYTVYILYTLA